MIQPYQAMRRKLVAGRLLAMLIAGVPFPKYRGFYLLHNALQVPFKDNWNNFKGMLYRLREMPRYKDLFVFQLLAAVAATISPIKHAIGNLLTHKNRSAARFDSHQ
jgi:hypothetical protein